MSTCWSATTGLAPNEHNACCVLCGKPYWPSRMRWPTGLDQLINTLEHNPGFKHSFMDSFKTAGRHASSNRADVVKMCSDNQLVRETIDQFIDGFSSCDRGCMLKNPEMSAYYRKKGNAHFANKRYKEAANCYCSAIRFAPEPDKDTSDDIASLLPRAFAKRSAAYLALGYYEEAILDLSVALNKYRYGKSPVKLHVRHAECLLGLGRYDQARDLLPDDKTLATLENEDRGRWNELNYQMIEQRNQQQQKKPSEKVAKKEFTSSVALRDYLTEQGRFESHPHVSSLNSKVAIYSKETGHYLEAKENIEFGEVLALASPYVSVLSSRVAVTNCHHCSIKLVDSSNRVKRVVTCPKCTVVSYCSEQCRTESLVSYHRFECSSVSNPILPTLYHIGQREHLALRLVFTTKSMANLHAASDSNKGQMFPSDPINYKHLYSLKHNSDKLALLPKELLRNTINACLLLKLAQLSEFCKGSSETDLDFLGGTLLLHLNVLTFSSLAALHRSFPLIDPIQNDYTQVKALHMPDQHFDGLYPLISLLNHSCSPNSRVRLELGTNFGVLQAERSIPPGTELTISYGPYAGEQQPFKARGRALKDRFCFTCNCEHCEVELRDCPPDEVISIPNDICYSLRCERCSTGLLTRTIISTNYTCDQCPYESTEAEVRVRYGLIEQLYAQKKSNPAESALKQAGEALDVALYSENVPKFEQIVTEFGRQLHPTSSHYCNLRAQLLSYFVFESFLTSLVSEKKSAAAKKLSKKIWKNMKEHLAVLESSFYGGDSMQLFGFLHQLKRWYGPLLTRQTRLAGKKDYALRRYGIDQEMVDWLKLNVRVRYQRLLNKLDVLSQDSLDAMLARFEFNLAWMEKMKFEM